MKKMRLLLLIPVVASVFISCEKEVDLQNDGNPGIGGTGGTGNNNRDITGDYEFAGLTGSAITTSVVDDILGQTKAVGNQQYATSNNTGTVTITSNKLTYSNLAYSVAGNINVQLYLGSLLLSEQDQPFAYDEPPTSGDDNFVKNSNDSLTFDNLIFLDSNPYGPTVDPGKMGARVSWSGDTLLLKIRHSFTGNIDYQGTNADYSATVDAVVKLKKK